MSLYRYRLHKIDSWDVPKWSKFSLLGTCCMYLNEFLTIGGIIWKITHHSKGSSRHYYSCINKVFQLWYHFSELFVVLKRLNRYTYFFCYIRLSFWSLIIIRWLLILIPIISRSALFYIINSFKFFNTFAEFNCIRITNTTLTNISFNTNLNYYLNRSVVNPTSITSENIYCCIFLWFYISPRSIYQVLKFYNVNIPPPVEWEISW